MNKTTIIKINNSSSVPYVLCTLRQDFDLGLQFYCQWCKEIHRHGRGEGSRSSHCKHKDSPLYGKEYIIFLGRNDRRIARRTAPKSYFIQDIKVVPCLNCTGLFVPARIGQIYCSSTCRELHLLNKYAR